MRSSLALGTVTFGTRKASMTHAALGTALIALKIELGSSGAVQCLAQALHLIHI